ncbi:MAG: hypothetical protein WCG40_02840 [Actinomycetes bacterium]
MEKPNEDDSLLGHYDDDPFAEIPTLNDVTDEQMLAMHDDPEHLKFLRKHDEHKTDEQFEVDIEQHKGWLRTCIAMREEEDEEEYG